MKEFLVESSTERIEAAGTPVEIPIAKGVTVVHEAGADLVEPEAGDGDVSTSALSPGRWESWYRVTQKILGVTVTRLRINLSYTTNGSRITKTHKVWGERTNFNLVVRLSTHNLSHWVSSGRGYGQLTWRGTIGGTIKGVPIRVDIDKRHRIEVDKNGYRSGYLRNI
ncbi:hypothetical protein GTW20_26695 [Nocardiopsis alba]|uniref:Uncharacterized protein n=1 Tax=Nocardiopsis alba TaxID=53437 RepID=A0A7K2J0Q8_9ACTN|nr:hypothetical protein [Nocardiopsis alba]MYR35748.1 hypothetical protein [Nocardiopsis alba]